MNINHRDKDGQCLLTIAMMKHDYDITKILVKMPGINLDVIARAILSYFLGVANFFLVPGRDKYTLWDR